MVPLNSNAFNIRLNNEHFIIEIDRAKYNFTPSFENNNNSFCATKIFYLKKEAIGIIHIFDEMFENNPDKGTIRIICPNINNFEDALEKIIYYCNSYYYNNIIIDKRFNDVFYQWNRAFISSMNKDLLFDCIRLCDFLNCSIFLDILRSAQSRYLESIKNSFISFEDINNIEKTNMNINNIINLFEKISITTIEEELINQFLLICI